MRDVAAASRGEQVGRRAVVSGTTPTGTTLPGTTGVEPADPFCSCVYVGLAKTASAPPIQILETISSQYVHDAGRLPPSDPRII